jgi:hypothetical protein
MPRSSGFSVLLTASQSADRLRVGIERVLLWAVEGRLRIAGQDEDGRALFREHVIDTAGRPRPLSLREAVIWQTGAGSSYLFFNR